MAKRETKKVLTGVTEEQYLESMNIYAINDAEGDKIVAKVNSEIARLKEKYDQPLQLCVENKKKHMAVIMAYCVENKTELFKDKRHLENSYGKVGFRLGTPKLKVLPKWTWESVLEKVKTLLPEFVRKTEEVDKEGLILNRDKEGIKEHLADVGIYVAQDDSFYIELKKEEQPATA